MQLSNLYDKMNRLVEAEMFICQAAEKYIEIHDLSKEGLCRTNHAYKLIKMKQYNEARREILRAIECNKPFGYSNEPWKSYNILCDLEKAVGNELAALKAWDQAFQLFLSYRRAGGGNHTKAGELCTMMNQLVNKIPSNELVKILEAQTDKINEGSAIKLFFSKLISILGGSRDTELAADPNLHYMDAVELVLLMEKLEKMEVSKL